MQLHLAKGLNFMGVEKDFKLMAEDPHPPVYVTNLPLTQIWLRTPPPSSVTVTTLELDDKFWDFVELFSQGFPEFSHEFLDLSSGLR